MLTRRRLFERAAGVVAALVAAPRLLVTRPTPSFQETFELGLANVFSLVRRDLEGWHGHLLIYDDLEDDYVEWCKARGLEGNDAAE